MRSVSITGITYFKRLSLSTRFTLPWSSQWMKPAASCYGCNTNWKYSSWQHPPDGTCQEAPPICQQQFKMPSPIATPNGSHLTSWVLVPSGALRLDCLCLISGCSTINPFCILLFGLNSNSLPIVFLFNYLTAWPRLLHYWALKQWYIYSCRYCDGLLVW